jgi:hypothetical protein
VLKNIFFFLLDLTYIRFKSVFVIALYTKAVRRFAVNKKQTKMFKFLYYTGRTGCTGCTGSGHLANLLCCKESEHF